MKKKRPNPRVARLKPQKVTTDVGSRDGPDACASFPIVGIGASAGGLEAFIQLLKHLPLNTGMGFVLVQHLDPLHESALAQILGRATSLPVEEVTNNAAVRPNHVYIIPPDTNLSIEQGALMLGPRARTRIPHHPIDDFFESLAMDQRECAIGVVLSGTASDGTLGLEAIKAEGGITFAQDDSAKYDSMPRSAIAAGCVDLVLSPVDIANELGRIAKHPYVVSRERSLRPELDHAEAIEHQDEGKPLLSEGSANSGARQAHIVDTGSRDGSEDSPQPKLTDNGYKNILSLLRNHSGVDFSLYKSNTIQRRIARRLVLNHHDTLESYCKFLRNNVKELDSLYSDVLISVTSFFRNPETFDVLQREVFPTLLQRQGDNSLRAWVLGCSTGQEAYSIAMSFVECAQKASRVRKLQIFATDVNDTVLEKARHGLYAKSLVSDITPQRLSRFFTEEDGGYRINKELREMVVFARQNLIADPPFSRLDLISCRNLLIYLEPSLQKKAIPTFHYSLKAGGFLLLGASESIGGFTDLFEPVDRKHKIFCRKPAPIAGYHLPVARGHGERSERSAAAVPVLDLVHEVVHAELSVQREADRIAINRFAPPGVLINDQLQVMQFRGLTGKYLEPPAGKASFDVLKMAREGLMLPLRAAITQAKKDNKPAIAENVRVKRDGEIRTIHLEVIPLKNVSERCFLIVFKETEGALVGSGASAPREKPAKPELSKKEDTNRVAELETDLAETREFLQSIQEQYEAANEELQSANEEVQSANEELQSINEELETSKEELESANEELMTVNEEMSNRNVELNRLNNDLLNLQASIKIAVILLGRDLAIRRFSPQANEQFGLLASDLGRPISQVRHNLSLNGANAPQSALDLATICAEVIASVREQECELQDQAGRWYSLRVRPYMTVDNKVDGAVLVLVDIDAVKQSEMAVATARDYAQNTVDTVRDPMIVLNGEFRVESANRAYYRTFGCSPGETVGRFFCDLGNGEWNNPDLLLLLNDVLSLNKSIEEFEVEYEFEQLGQRVMLLNARRTHNPLGSTARILIAIEDITERKQAQIERSLVDQELRDSNARFESLFEASPIGMYLIDSNFYIRLLSKAARPAFAGAGDPIGSDFVHTVHILWPSDIADEIIARFRHTLETGEPYRAPEFTGERNDRKVREYYDWQIHRVALPDGKYGVVCYFIDVSARVLAEHALHNSELRYRRLFETAKDGILILDADTGKIIDANAFMSALVGLNPEDLKGRELHEIGMFADIEENKEAFRQLRNTGYLRHEHLPVCNQRGERVEVEFIANMYKEDRTLVAQCNVRDISQRVQMEEKINQQAHALADESRRKDEFLAMLSHELRNPLAPIRSAVHLLKLHEHGSENIVQRKAVEIIERQAGNLGKLISDLMEVSRVVSGRVHLNQRIIDLNEVVRHAVETTMPLLEERNHTLRVQCSSDPAWVSADTTRMEEVFVNLLNNAIKYTDDGGQIEIICNDPDGQDYAEVRVRDNGIGIDAELLPRIFDLFTQADRSLNRAAGGLGIGLSLAHRLVVLHGGSIEAHSPTEGNTQGSEFVVRLPRVAPPRISAPASTPESSEHQSNGVRVLVVDDNVDQVTMLTTILCHQGYSVRSAYNGLDGLKVAKQWLPELVLLDIGLPGLDGYEVARRLRMEPEMQPVTIIALTGYGCDSDITLEREAGFDAHLTKPFEFDALAELMLMRNQRGV